MHLSHTNSYQMQYLQPSNVTDTGARDVHQFLDGGDVTSDSYRVLPHHLTATPPHHVARVQHLPDVTELPIRQLSRANSPDYVPDLLKTKINTLQPSLVGTADITRPS